MAIKSPCLTCEDQKADKSSAKCTNCADRIAYVRGIGTFPSSNKPVAVLPRIEKPRLAPLPIKEADEPAPIKSCSKCGEFKALEDFDRAKTAKDGRSSSCITCRQKYQRGLNAKNKNMRQTAKEKMETDLQPVPQKKEPVTERKKEESAYLTVDFTDYPELLDALRKEAKDKIRSTENQLLYISKWYVKNREVACG